MFQTLSTVLLPTLVIIAATTDIMSFRIPNLLNIIIALLFFPMALAAGMPAQEILVHVAVAAAVMGAGFVLYSFKLLGGGDVKLAAAVGLWLGAAHTPQFLIITAIAGGALAIMMLIANYLKVIATVDFKDFLPNARNIDTRMPYGVALAVGVLLVFPITEWMPK